MLRVQNGTVDIHTHFAPPETVAAVRAGSGIDGLRMEVVDGQEWMVHRQGFRWPLHRTFHDLEARIAAMDARDCDVAVLSIAPPFFMYWAEDVSETADFCRTANDALAAFARDSGGRIAAVATLPMRDPAAAVAELRRAVTSLGLRGAEIGPQINGMWLDDPSLRPVLVTAAELGVPLILHPNTVGVRAGLEPFYLTNLVGNPLETTVGAAHLIFGGVLDEVPGLVPVLMHGGGYLPYQIGRLDHGHHVRAEAKGCRQDPSDYLRRFFYDTLTHAPGPLSFLIGQVGAERVMYGTDFPFDMGGGPVAEQLTGVDLEEAERIAIAGANATTLFGLKP